MAYSRVMALRTFRPVSNGALVVPHLDIKVSTLPTSTKASSALLQVHLIFNDSRNALCRNSGPTLQFSALHTTFG